MNTDDTTKLYVKEQLDEHDKENDMRYAIKLVERIVFGAVGFIAFAVLSALVALVVLK
tara:strand:+ start:114 stop:287 length:174 start_codon:yes stop_codon:yes gene_type:complete